MFIYRNTPFFCKYFNYYVNYYANLDQDNWSALHWNNNRLRLKFSECRGEACTFHKWECAWQSGTGILVWIFYLCLCKKTKSNHKHAPTQFLLGFFLAGWSNPCKHIWWDCELCHHSQWDHQSLPRAGAEGTSGGQTGRWVLLDSLQNHPSGSQ